MIAMPYWRGLPRRVDPLTATQRAWLRKQDETR